MASGSSDVLWWIKIVLAVLIPPLAVALEFINELCATPTLILIITTLILWLLGWIPGAVFALVIILSADARDKLMGWMSRKPAQQQQQTIAMSAVPAQQPAQSRGWFGRGQQPQPAPAANPFAQQGATSAV